VKSPKGNEVDSHFPERGVGQPGKPQSTGDIGDVVRDYLVDVFIFWHFDLESINTQLIKSLVLEDVAHVRLLEEALQAQHCVVRLEHIL
jgi:hypothetical protein